MIPRRTKNRHRLDRQVAKPCSASAFWISVRPRIRLEWPSIRPERRSPPNGPGRTAPCVRTCERQPIALDAQPRTGPPPNGRTFHPQSRQSHDPVSLPKAPCSCRHPPPAMKIESEPGTLRIPNDPIWSPNALALGATQARKSGLCCPFYPSTITPIMCV